MGVRNTRREDTYEPEQPKIWPRKLSGARCARRDRYGNMCTLPLYEGETCSCEGRGVG